MSLSAAAWCRASSCRIHGDDIAFHHQWLGPGRLFEGLLVRRSAPDSPAIPDRASPTTRNVVSVHDGVPGNRPHPGAPVGIDVVTFG